eukprot:CAMPEP_0194295138 /NCGR_PEP_ID=MMETSP0169-20130528/52681_1 /TAXON_ID=218684 /ORGANISM="Corethron pennatum, Strain L29A3" /LENGTH=427 /DNA_ID=CAMNT_0039044241 /DNA_START=61 /DNA_END=1344 /DNA_ORIENTATION=-
MTRTVLSSMPTLLLVAALQSGVRRGAVAFAVRPSPPATAATRALSSATSSTSAPPAVHVPVGADGDGAYTAATKGCFDVIDAAAPLVLREVARMPLDPRRPFHVADYGTADAGTSLGLLTGVVRAVRARSDAGAAHEVVLHYEDQAGNEWKSVFAHALGHRRVSDAYGRAVPCPTDGGGVFVEACGVGFHARCYPRGSVDLGVSFTAMHWLSSSPSSLGGREEMHAARCARAPEAERARAAADWDAILAARAEELVAGGRFVCVNFCVSGEGYFLGQTDRGASMWDSFAEAWGGLCADGTIGEGERTGVSFPNYYRTAQEFAEGVGRRPDLKLVSAEERIVRCPYREQYVDGGKEKMSREEYARAFVPTTRTWSHSTFKAALDDGRSDGEKEEILEKFWKNYEELVARNPEEHGMDYVHSYLVIEKV